MAKPSSAGPFKDALQEELGPLLEDQEIAVLFRQNKLHDLYYLLKRKVKTAGTIERPVIQGLLASRRLFAEPCPNPPVMFTLNGCGTKLYGKGEEDGGDNSYISTLFIVFGFLPVFPLGQYLVGSAGSREWFFFGKVPTEVIVWVWRNIALLLVIVAVTLLQTSCARDLWRLFTLLTNTE